MPPTEGGGMEIIMNVSLNYLGILIALNIAVWNTIHTSPIKFICFNILIILGCSLIDWCETKFRNLQSEILDFFVFSLTLNKRDYKINSRIETYSIKTKNLATFTSTANIKIKKNSDNFCYTDCFHWEQEDKFKVRVDSDYKYFLEEDLNWTKIVITPESFVAGKNQEKTIKYNIENLTINNLKRHSFLSCNPKDKIKMLKLIAYVDNNLNPNTEARFIVQNNNGDTIRTEKLQYNPKSQYFEKTIKYPRQSRKYIIKWDYLPT